MTNALTTTTSSVRTFWQRKEGKVGKWAIALGGGILALGVIVNANRLLEWLIQLLSNTLHAAALLGAVVALGYVLFTENRIKTLAVTLFQVGIYHLTNLFIDLNPIAILKNCLREAREDDRSIQEQKDSIEGVVQLIRDTKEHNERERQKSLKLADQAEKQRKTTEQQLQMMRAARAQQSNDLYDQDLNDVGEVLANLDELHDVVKFMVGDMESEVQQAEQRHRISTAVGNAVRSAWRILRYNDSRALYNETNERLAATYAQRIGEIRSLRNASKDIISTMRLQQGVLADEGRRQLAEWRKGVKALLPAATAPAVVLPAAHAEEDMAPVRRRGLEDLLD